MAVKSLKNSEERALSAVLNYFLLEGTECDYLIQELSIETLESTVQSFYTGRVNEGTLLRSQFDQLYRILSKSHSV